MVCIMTTGVLDAQEITISEPIAIRSEVAYYLLGKQQGRHLILREQPNKFIINAYSNDMTLAWEKELELEKRRPEIIEAYDYDDRFYVLYTHRRKGASYLRIHKYDGGANLVDSTLVMNIGNEFLRSDFNVIRSENERMLQIELDRTGDERFLTVFDLKKMKVVYSTEFEDPDHNPFTEYSQLLVGDDGSSYYIIEKNNRRLGKKSNHHFKVHYYDAGSKSNSSFKLNMGGRLTYHVLFKLDNLNQKIVGAGYYSDRGLTRANGTFILKSDQTNAAQAVLKFQKFDSQLLETVEGKNRRQRKFLSGILVRDIVLRRDGGALIVGEKFKRLESRPTGGNGTFRSNTILGAFASDFYFDDIFIVAHHPEGEVHWTNFYYKRQYSKNDSGIYSSYFLMHTPSQLKLLFNDEIEQNTTVSAYNVSPLGDYDRNALMNANYRNVKLRVSDAVQISATEVVIPSEFRNELRLMRVLF